MKKRQIRLILAGYRQKEKNYAVAGNYEKASCYTKGISKLVREYNNA